MFYFQRIYVVEGKKSFFFFIAFWPFFVTFVTGCGPKSCLLTMHIFFGLFAGGKSDPSLYSLEVHHGGRFSVRPMKLYTGGKIDTFHDLNPDYISMLEMEAIAQDLGYSGHVAFYYKKRGFSLDKGLVPFSTDKEAIKMLDFLHKDRVAKVYLDHKGGETLLESQVGSSNIIAAHQRDPHLEELSEVEVCDLTLETEQNVGAIDGGIGLGPTDGGIGFGPTDGRTGFDVETDLGFQDMLLMDPSVGFDVDFGIGSDYVNLNEDIGNGNLGFDATDILEFEGNRVISSDKDSSDGVYYSDHSYRETDDDELYEAYNIDKEEEFVGVPKDNFKGPKVCEDEILSDGDSKYDSDYSFSNSSDDENGHNRRKYDFKTFRPGTDMEDPRFKVGQLFSTTQDFKAAVKQHAIKHQRPLKLVKNDKRRVRARCQGEDCNWEGYAYKVLGESTYQVRTYTSNHNCIKTYSNRNVTSTMIARKYQDDLRTNPRLPIPAFKERVRKELKVDVTRNRLYRAKRKAAALICGSDLEQYGRLWDYCEELRRSNPGSTVVMDAHQWMKNLGNQNLTEFTYS
ncbi:uncharacterized protein LOC131327411 [Rhododendron vialii]|uniref:uncharacterized protein LOC131327411 n=1 Tax=Rhododendron vialii TaxID=182163 RepID=UPI0026603E2E|nr:uncharacterized protein LOC131327411 [Rhododendron vialii]